MFAIDVSYFRLVIETLKDKDDDRKCFRMVGGVLVERTVKEVLPALQSNSEAVGHTSSYAVQCSPLWGEGKKMYNTETSINCVRNTLVII